MIDFLFLSVSFGHFTFVLNHGFRGVVGPKGVVFLKGFDGAEVWVVFGHVLERGNIGYPTF